MEFKYNTANYTFRNSELREFKKHSQVMAEDVQPSQWSKSEFIYFTKVFHKGYFFLCQQYIVDNTEGMKYSNNFHMGLQGLNKL